MRLYMYSLIYVLNIKYHDFMRFLSLFVYFFLFLMISCSKEPSDKVLNPLDVNELQNLEVLCKVWGLVKYHHPAFMDGSDRDADTDLLALIPKVREANVITRNKILLNWIKELGPYYSSKDGFDQYIRNFRVFTHSTKPEILTYLTWMENESILGTKLSAELPKVRYAIRSKKNKYIETNSSLNFLEERYPNLTDPSLEYRLLALFRYWNVIEFFSPTKNLIHRLWDDVLFTHIPAFLQATGSLEYRLAIARLIAETCDASNNVRDWVPVFGNRSPIGLSKSFVGEKLIVNRVLESSGFQIKPGDEIVSIGGKSVADLKSKVSEYFPVSNNAHLLWIVENWATYTNDATLTIDYLSDNEFKTEVFPTEQIRNQPTQVTISKQSFPLAYTLIEGGAIGYINAAYFEMNEAPAMMNELKDTKGVIFDMRGIPKSSFNDLAYGYFTSSNILFLNLGILDVYTPGILYRADRSNAEFTTISNQGNYRGKVIIIVNQSTRGEYTTMLLQTIPGAITIGSQTIGLLSGNNTLYLPGNIYTYIPICSVRYFQTENDTQRNGIHIDIEVKPTIAGIKAGRDELYEKAVELILN